ncbi:hypothetical protein JD844_012226 [Phrynosoma platyrhinos]|uniref:Leukotriene C4 synthase n=1 Tax=Phrynosoma platyrhinos TaxID=52577 RepID=A0ABQ7TJ69_PHRPL|nr:hypothetical protein JD844_012226 [Phrynosoma platyrhinos]
MLHQIALLATVTILGVLEQAYFAMQVIYARRKCKISPPLTSGPPEFERIFRAHLPIVTIWITLFFLVLAAFCGLIYLFARYQYFIRYAHSAQGRLGPMYFSAGVLCFLIALSVVGLTAHFIAFPYFKF